LRRPPAGRPAAASLGLVGRRGRDSNGLAEGAARASLEALVRTTIEARATGRLSPEQADRILAATARLTADLPMPEPTTTKPPSDQQDEKKDKKKDEGNDNGTEGGSDEEHGGNGGDGDED
jgi:hypothetical protein